MIRTLIKIIKAFTSDANPNSLALAISLGAIMGLTPLMSPHNLLFLFIVLLFRIHLSTFIIALSGFSILGLLLDPLFDSFGYFILTHSSLTESFTQLYNLSIGRISLFNNTIVMGSLIFSCLLFLPLYFLSKHFVVRYRITFTRWMEQSKIVIMLKGTNIFRLFSSSQETSL